VIGWVGIIILFCSTGAWRCGRGSATLASAGYFADDVN